MNTVRILKVDNFGGRELPFDMDILLALRPTGRPETDIQAIMETAPGQIEEPSKQALQPIREAVADCIESLDSRDQFIINSLMSEQITFAELGKRLRSIYTSRLEACTRCLQEGKGINAEASSNYRLLEV